jgi:hypothetical protein
VVHDVGARVEDRVEVLVLAAQVGNQDLDADARAEPADLADRLREDERAPVGQVVARYRGEHRELEPHVLDRLRDAPGLVRVERRRDAASYGAEPAAARADVAQQHERRRAAAPALGDVGAVRAVTDRVQPVDLDDLLGPAERVPVVELDLEPRRTLHARIQASKFSR